MIQMLNKKYRKWIEKLWSCSNKQSEKLCSGRISGRSFLPYFTDGHKIFVYLATGDRPAKKTLSSGSFQLRRLNVDFDEIQKAMEDVVRDTFDYFLDLETGEVLTFSEEIVREMKERLYDDEYDEIKDDIEYIEFDEEPEIPDWMTDEMDMALEILLDESGRYVRIPERETRFAYQSMNDFIDMVEDLTLKKELSEALNGKGAFRKFKDILIGVPRERKRWHGYNAKAMKKEITEWLKTLGIAAAPRQKTL
jgi:hypothetical protein